MKELGMVEEANLADAWNHEAYEFTPWLAENLSRPSSEIGLDLELVGTEVAAEQFSAHILARSIKDDSMVPIENQLEFADHRHPGQILTYLAGLDAKKIIWSAADFRSAHLEDKSPVQLPSTVKRGQQ